MARVFSHKPSLVSFEGEPGEFDDERLRHNGQTAGYLFEVLGVEEADVVPHPTTTMAPGIEWLTQRELELKLVDETTPRLEELLTTADVETLLERARRREERESSDRP